ncbi:prenyltransferase [Pleionea sediminis]|uniref:prenyltransferase n=1 Tax=Pleionea sediminis TaxID=2569479 RepID=UPI001184F37B|nr:prenyltransferase [Pleionea sediminis]
MRRNQSSSALTSLGSTRPPFLLLTPACLLLAFGASAYLGANVEVQKLVLILIAGIAAHISVNTLNEYFDFKSGLDLITQKTPFSGGSGTLPQYPEQAKNVLIIAVLSLLICIAIGFYFTITIGWELLVVGLFGVLLIIFYTTHITRMPWLCLIAPGSAFGPIMIMGTGFIFLGEFSPPLALLSLVTFFLVNNLLLLNQLPDINADKSIGRNHLPIKIGRAASLKIFALFNLLALIVVLIIYSLNYFHTSILLALIPLMIANVYSVQLTRAPHNDTLLKRTMPLNVMVNLTTPFIIGTSLWMSSS